MIAVLVLPGAGKLSASIRRVERLGGEPLRAHVRGREHVVVARLSTTDVRTRVAVAIRNESMRLEGELSDATAPAHTPQLKSDIVFV